MSAVSGLISAEGAQLFERPASNPVGDLPLQTPITLLRDFGDGWPLISTGQDASARIGFVDNRMVAWAAAQPAAPIPPVAPPTPPVAPPTPVAPPAPAVAANPPVAPPTPVTPTPVAPPAPAASGPTFTASPNERATKRTQVSPDDMRTAVASGWAALSATGCKLIVAQYLFETNRGAACFNFNFGNHKAKDATFLHMYLKNVWECFSHSGALAQVSASNGLARIPGSAEIQQHGWSCADTVVVFSPPHRQCMFRAFDSLGDGAQGWLATFKAYANRHDGMIASINQGDVGAFVQILRAESYFTGAVDSYVRGVQRMMQGLA